MKGTNMLKLNQQTLVSALQDYLDSEMPGHKVKSVNLPGDGYFGSHAGALVDELVVVVEEANSDGKTMADCQARGER